jgi:hypothetical protein
VPARAPISNAWPTINYLIRAISKIFVQLNILDIQGFETSRTKWHKPIKILIDLIEKYPTCVFPLFWWKLQLATMHFNGKIIILQPTQRRGIFSTRRNAKFSHLYSFCLVFFLYSLLPLFYINKSYKTIHALHYFYEKKKQNQQKSENLLFVPTFFLRSSAKKNIYLKQCKCYKNLIYI